MECKNCRYYTARNQGLIFGSCIITNMCNTKSCTIPSDDDVKKLHICYNCQHWYGGGDFGLSCAKNYHNCSSNGFDEACEQFERKSDILDQW